MGIIFDLDQTIVDSRIAEPFRPSDWAKVYSLIPKFKVYNGIPSLFEFIQSRNLEITIVTSSPSTYSLKVLKHFKIPYHHVVGYHDTTYKKPHAEPMLKALEKMKLKPNEVVSLGDRSTDIQSAKSAGIITIGCSWGSNEDLTEFNPDYLIYEPLEAIKIIGEDLNLKGKGFGKDDIPF